MTHPRIPAAVWALLLLATPAAGQEAEEELDPWSNTTEFALVQTTGNSESFTLSFKNLFERRYARSRLTVEALALRAESTTRELTNVDGEVVATSDTELAGEQYALSVQYLRDISERLAWFTLGGWERNRPSGLDNRYAIDGGVAYELLATEVDKLVAEAGLGFAWEEPLGGDTSEYPTARLFSGYERKLSATASFDTSLELIENLDDTDDLRVNFLIGLTAKMTERLALRVSYTVSFDNRPLTELVESEEPETPPAVFTFDDTDTILAASLVIDF